MIRFDNVSKQYSGTSRPALDAVSLEVLRGEFVFLVGASGSGKSSCLRLMLKEEKPSKGKIHVLGQDLGTISSRKVPYFRRNLGVVFQDFRLLPNKSVFDNVAFSLQVIGKSRGFIQEAVPDVLNMVGLAGKSARLPHELSGGEQQRVAIARAVVNKPQVLLADEPTGNLDPATSAGIMAVLERINASGTTVIMATHEAGIVDQMQRRVIELVNGQVVRDERHGGYGFTAAIPTIAVTSPAIPSVAEALSSDSVVADSAWQTPAPGAHSAARAGAVENGVVPTAQAPAEPAANPTAPASRYVAPTFTQTVEQIFPPDALVPKTATDAGAPENAGPAPEADEASKLNANFGGTPTHPVVRPRTPEGDLPDQLSLAERLGLRGAVDRKPDEKQDVGPTT